LLVEDRVADIVFIDKQPKKYNTNEI